MKTMTRLDNILNIISIILFILNFIQKKKKKKLKGNIKRGDALGLGPNKRSLEGKVIIAILTFL